MIRPIKPLAWVEEMKNKLGMISRSKMHYARMVAVNDMPSEAIFDFGEACSLIDLRTARRFRLPVQLATKQ